MANLLRDAYLIELFLWIPLAGFFVTTPAARRWLVPPLVVSVLAAAYEACMTFVWEPKVVAPIRIDIFLVLFVACAANTISGLAFIVTSKGRAEGKRLVAAAMACFVVPVLAIAGLAVLRSHTGQLDAKLEAGRRYRFEAAFRDEATRKRVFGTSDYYVAGDEDKRIKHLVVNEAGHFWLYGADLYVVEGERDGKPRNPRDKAVIALRPVSGDAYELEVDLGLGAALAPPKKVTVRKAAPPSFPRPSSPGDEVRFLGEFSGSYSEHGRSFFVVQMWLWESKGQVWGRQVHDAFVRGSRRDFIHPEEMRIKCTIDCKMLVLETDRGPKVYERVSGDSFVGKFGAPEVEVTLNRGERIPGFLLDLAPLASASENRAWLDAVLEARMLSWDVPAR